METAVQYMPDKKPDKLIQKGSYIGQPVSRVDGQLKVTEEATFTAEYKLDNICYAALAYSTIAKGKISKLHLSDAQNAEGVITIITHENCPKLQKPVLFNPGGSGKGVAASDIPVMQDENIYWNGQPIAVVVAATQEQAEQAVTLITADYKTDNARLSFDALKSKAETPAKLMTEPAEIKIGDAEKELKKAAYAVDNLYHTPRYNYNAIEPHATIAVFKDDGKLVVFESTQQV